MLAKLKELLKPTVDTNVKLSGIALFIGRQIEKIENRIVSLEARQLQKGDKGDKGDKGEHGKDGKDGADGKNGLSGKDGKDGLNGKDGLDGVSVVDSWIAADGHLVMVLSNGNEIDVGDITSEESKSYQLSRQLANFQITVSTTSPSNPAVNQLWFDLN